MHPCCQRWSRTSPDFASRQAAPGNRRWRRAVAARAAPADGADPAAAPADGTTPTEPAPPSPPPRQRQPGRAAGPATAAPPQPQPAPPCRLPPPPDLGGAEPRSRWNAASLAFLGDAVWEVYMRTALFKEGPWRPSRSAAAVARVNTHALAAVHDVLSLGGLLTGPEAAVLRWGANSATVGAPHHASRRDYKKATAVEVLVAHLYLTDPPRLERLMARLMEAPVQALWAGATRDSGGTTSGSDVESALGTLGTLGSAEEEEEGEGSEAAESQGERPGAASGGGSGEGGAGTGVAVGAPGSRPPLGREQTAGASASGPTAAAAERPPAATARPKAAGFGGGGKARGKRADKGVAPTA